MRQTPRWKNAVIIWIAIYPLITSLMLIAGKWLNQINPMPLRTLCMTIILVPTMVFIIIPLLNKIFKNWLNRK